MISLYVPDIGHGLAAGIRTISSEKAQIDCGSSDDANGAARRGLQSIRPDLFILSHFHMDHYNGLFTASKSSQDIERVVYPQIPEFPEKREFLRDMVAMAHRAMGSRTGSMEADFLHILSKINRSKFRFRSVAEGDRVRIGSSQFEVVWPPRVIDERIRDKVQNALKTFEAAREVDPELRRITDDIDERHTIRPFPDTEGWHDLSEGYEQYRERDDLLSHEQERDLPESVEDANRALRRAANHLSLAFYQDDRLLFMGDLEEKEIEQIVAHLTNMDREHFLAMITPHHGTKWNDDMKQLDSWWAISSVGKQLIGKVDPKYKTICDNHWVTYLNGDLSLPILRRWRDPRLRGYGWPVI